MNTVYVLGAGVDFPLGFPLASDLMKELDAFVKGDGKEVSKAIKDKLGGGRRVRFSFEKYVANQGENSFETLLNDQSMLGTLEKCLEGIGKDASPLAKAVKVLVSKCKAISEANSLDTDTAVALATGTGQTEEMADHTVFRTRGITFNPSPRDAILQILADPQSMKEISTDEQKKLDGFASKFKNFEELLTELFAAFYSSNMSGMRSYLYVSWLLWVYMRWKSLAAKSQLSNIEHFYAHLTTLPDTDSIITFNYSTLVELPSDRTVRFHGDCLSYIRHDRGHMISSDERVTNAGDLPAIVTFVNELDLNLDENRIFLPAIVPPSAMKPLINRDFIARWAQADQLMKKADVMIVVGYSFNRVDNHFNEMFAAAAGGKKVAIINPDLEGTKSAVCDLLSIDPGSLTKQTINSVQVDSSHNLLFVPSYSQDVTADMLEKIRSGW